MQLSIKPYHKNIYPAGGILLKGSKLDIWLNEIWRMGFTLPTINVYPIPSKIPGDIWGCLILTTNTLADIDIGRNTYCQVIKGKLFVPPNCCIYPQLADDELEKLLCNKKHILHPDFGFVALEETVNWQNVINIPCSLQVQVKSPAKGLFIPADIKRCEVHVLPPEKVLESMEEKLFPPVKEFNNKPLSFFEKAKLAIYRMLFKQDSERFSSSEETKPQPLLDKIGKTLKPILKSTEKLLDKMLMNYEELEKRNQAQVDKLLDLFKSNPEEALKYAIPLNGDGTARGGNHGQFQFTKNWFELSIKARYTTGSGGSNVLIPNEYFSILRNQYIDTAKALANEGEYEKAAFVYMKLLKDYTVAAETLMQGGMYAEAASIYLKYTNNKLKAAACYEQGSMYAQAIELHKELGNEEKIGDLYICINRPEDAFKYYNKVADGYLNSFQFVKAATLYKAKMNDFERAQDALLTGWRANRDGSNCLGSYFNNIADDALLEKTIEKIYLAETSEQNKGIFLLVIKKEFEKRLPASDTVKEIAYEIIADIATRDPEIISEIKNFNKKDTIILKDIMRYKTNRRSSNKTIGIIISGIKGRQ